MTIKEFFESEEKLAIHCDTQEKAIALLKAFDMAGYTWWNGIKYTVITYWYLHKENTCYNNRGCCCDKEFYQDIGYKIIEFRN